MSTFTFILVLDGPAFAESAVDLLHDSNCDDAAFGSRGSQQIAEFDREAPTLGAALLSAIHDVESGAPGHRVIRVEPDDLVNAATIAERTGRSRESIRLLASGQRGEGGFPKPITWLDGGGQIWRWGEVCSWFHQRGEPIESAGGGAPQFIAALNGVLETRFQIVALARVAAHEDAPTLAFTSDAVGALPKLLAEPTRALVLELAGSS